MTRLVVDRKRCSRGTVLALWRSDADSNQSSFTEICATQDGKSNVWAVEPKMQVEVAKEGEGVMKGGIVAGGAAAAITLAAVVVANLPDFDSI